MVSETRQSLCRLVRETLAAAGCEDAAFESDCLLEDLGGVSRDSRLRDPAAPVSPDAVRAVLDAVSQRAAGRPLQYLLGNWAFLGLRLRVGEGVLIPRPETELLCETAAQALREIPAARVLDLGAGTGCVGLGIASLCPGVRVTAVEASDEALAFLRENLARYPQWDVRAQKADILTDSGRFPPAFHAVVSNPPYIPRGDLPGLQREVQREPRAALDGGEDGLRFYRCIARDWVPKLLPGGIVALEVGIGQAQAVKELLLEQGIDGLKVVPDGAGIDRVVWGRREF